MKTKNALIVLLSRCFLLILLSGCSVIRKGENQTETTKDTDTPVPTVTHLTIPSAAPSKTPNTGGLRPTPTQIVYPTISAQQQQLLFAGLHDEDCILPCYLGITPGKTTLEEAQIIMEKLGASPTKTVVVFSDPSYSNKSYRLDVGTATWQVYHSIDLSVRKGLVRRIEVEVRLLEAPDFYDYWSRYSLHSLMKMLGAPDEGYMTITPNGTAYTILLLYKGKGLVVDTHGETESGLVCPQFEANKTTAVYMVITDPASSLGLFIEEMATPYDNDPIWDPMQDVLGIDEQQFHDAILANPGICFEPIAEP